MRHVDPNEQLEVAERDGKIIELRRAGWGYRDIAAEMNLSMSRCFQIFDKYRKQVPNAEIAAWREEELDLLGKGVRDLLERLVKMPHEAQWAKSAAECWKEVRQHSESRRKILGVDAPVKRELELVDTTSWEYQAQLGLTEIENELRAAALNQEE